MANPGAGRSQRNNNNAIPSYIDPDTPNTAERSPQYAPKFLETPATRPENLTEMRPPQSKTEAAAPELTAEQQIKDVSPELIAAITERVKKELVEHLKQSASSEEDQKTKTAPRQPAATDPVEKPKPATVEDEPEAPALQRELSNKSQSSTSSPPPQFSRRVYTPPSPAQSPRQSHAQVPQPETSRSPPRSPSEKPSGVRFSDRPLPRPISGRSYSTMELSTVDQKWGRLFDGDGNPTQRLGQFLRGLANHIVGFVRQSSLRIYF